MKQISLYRKYRPSNFNEVCGQEIIVNILKNSIVNKRISHSYIFAGERGTGKTSTARIFAKAVNCLDLKNGEPCNACENCLSINSDSFLDIIEIDAASNNGVDEIRELREKIYYIPVKGNYKVYIIDEAHMITTQGFNAFLKTLEEPPDHAIFILATTEPEKILKTIHSRCQRFSFNKIDTEIIKRHIVNISEKEGFHIESSAAFNIAVAADGSIRDSLTILQEILFSSFENKKIDEHTVKNALGFITDYETNEIFKIISSQEENYDEIFDFADNLLAQRITVESVINSIFFKLSENMKKCSIDKNINLSLKQLMELLRYIMNCRADLRNIKNEGVFLKLVFFDLKSIIINNYSDNPLIKDKKLELPLENKSNSKKKSAKENKKLKKDTPIKKVEKVEIQQPMKSDSEIKFTDKHKSELLSKIKKNAPLIHALLREATEYVLKNKSLIIKFPAEMKFHKIKLELPENESVVNRELKNIFNQDIKAVFINNNDENNIDYDHTFEKSELIKQAENMSAVKKILEIFGGGKIINVKKMEDNEDG